MTVTTTIASSTSWQCPANVYYVDVKMRGGGGGGRGSDPTRVTNGGEGGDAGAYTASNLVAVTPGTYYTITIGQGGAPGANTDYGIAGTATTCFGLTAAGGDGGTAWTMGGGGAGGAGGNPAGGTAGQTGRSGSSPGAGGAASGGGGGGGGTPVYNGYAYEPSQGGTGGNGAVTIVYTLPTTAFTGTPLTGQYPVTTAWTNTSTDGVSYYWDFGNSTNSSLEDPADTTYTGPGSFTVTLTVTNTYGVNQLVRTGYVNVSRIPYCSGFIIVSDNLRGV